ncbi:MAG TPA: ribosome maturation factor RimM [Trebonia sp.]|nr:ribosome maturation factor RimM [Trebonia sp.]
MQVTVGRIGRPHGVRGDVVVGVRTDEPELRFAPGSRLDTDPVGVGPLTVAGRRWHSGELLVRFAEIGDRTAAAELGGTWLLVDSAVLDPLDDPDEFRDGDLVGLSVRTVGGTAVGTVTDVLHHGQDILVIDPASPAGSADPAGPAGPAGPAEPAAAARAVAGRPAGARAEQILIPFVKAIVPEVDIAGGVLVIDPPEGLLNLQDPT